MENETLNSAGKSLNSQASLAGITMDDLHDKFTEVVEDVESAGETILENLRQNRKTYLAFVIGAAVLGGAYMMFANWSKIQKLAVSATKGTVGKGKLASRAGKAARVH